jgi:hypothetical protein
MTYLKVIIVFLTMILTTTNEKARNPNQERELLRQFAFCKCFQYATDDSAYFLKRDVSLSVYRDLSAGYPESVYDQLDAMAKKAADDIKPAMADYEGKKAVLKGCLEFYDSDELKTAISKFQPAN